MVINMVDLRKLRELALAATPGPYQACGDDRGGCWCGLVWSKSGTKGSHVLTAEHHRESDDYPKPTKEQAMKNMLYYAAASPEVVLSLLAQITTLENSNDFLQNGLVTENERISELESKNKKCVHILAKQIANGEEFSD